MISQPCFWNRTYLPHSGGKHLLRRFMSGIAFQHPLFLAPHHLRHRPNANLMSHCFEFGDALPMSSFKRISASHYSHTWSSVSLLDIYLVTKDGSFTIQKQRSSSTVNVLNSMNTCFLGYLG